MDLKDRARKIKLYIPAIWVALRREDTPLAAKIAAGITVGYALSPIDLIPDFIPVLGYLDDLIILPLLAVFTVKLIPDEIMKECIAEAECQWKAGMPKKWSYAIPIILLWVAVVALVIWKLAA